MNIQEELRVLTHCFCVRERQRMVDDIMRRSPLLEAMIEAGRIGLWFWEWHGRKAPRRKAPRRKSLK